LTGLSKKKTPRFVAGWGGTLLLAGSLSGIRAFAQAAPAVTTPAAATRTLHDPTYKLSFDYPASWNFAHTDGEISTFRLDARSAAGTTAMRAVVAIPENPFPESTFSGAYFYFSVTPRSSAASCSDQAASPAAKQRKPTEKIISPK